MRQLFLLPLLLGGCAGGGPAPPEPSGKINVILIVMDTARADHFLRQDAAGSRTPRFDAFAGGGLRFTQAYSTSSWTVPAHASLFTGLLPTAHQATQESPALDRRLQTLAELLRERGYETAAFSDNPWISRSNQMLQGFEVVREMWVMDHQPEGDGLPHPTNVKISEWLEARDGERPFFLFINYIEPHWPYEPPAAYTEGSFPGGVTGAEEANFGKVEWYTQREEIASHLLPLRRGLYGAEVAFTDAILGELLDQLEARNLLDTSLVIATSDHGENLGEHEHQGHVFSLYDTTLRVPLAIRAAGGNGGPAVRDEPVQLTDIFTTIATAVGLTRRAAASPGHDLLSGPVPGGRPIVAEYLHPDQVLSQFPEDGSDERLSAFKRQLRSIRIGNDKLIWGSDGAHEMYDLAADPDESRNLAATAPERAAGLLQSLEALIAEQEPRRRKRPATPEMDETMRRRLRSLGYVR